MLYYATHTVPLTFLGVRFLLQVLSPFYPPHPACAVAQHYDPIAGVRVPADFRILIYESMRLPRYATSVIRIITN